MNNKGVLGLGDFDIGELTKILITIFFISIFIGIVLSITGISLGDMVAYSQDLVMDVVRQIPIIGPLLGGV